MAWYHGLVASLAIEDGTLAALTRPLVPGSDLKLQVRRQVLSTHPSEGTAGGTAHY